MNSQIPPTEPMDEQERKLARILRALPGGEPPAALDARILRAAANAAAESRTPRSRWLASAGALWGIGGAAAAVLALGVSWQMMYPARPSAPSESAPAAVMADQAEDSSVSVELKDRPTREYENAPPPASSVAQTPPARSEAQAAPAPARTRARTVAPSAAPGAPPLPTAMPEPFAGDQLDEHVAASAEAGASADAMTASQARSASNEERALAAKAASAETAAQATSMPQATGAAPATGALGNAQETPRMKPARWLAHIRQLRDDDRLAEAKASLREFHERYPDFVIPSDLAPLLRE